MNDGIFEDITAHLNEKNIAKKIRKRMFNVKRIFSLFYPFKN